MPGAWAVTMTHEDSPLGQSLDGIWEVAGFRHEAGLAYEDGPAGPEVLVLRLTRRPEPLADWERDLLRASPPAGQPGHVAAHQEIARRLGLPWPPAGGAQD